MEEDITRDQTMEPQSQFGDKRISLARVLEPKRQGQEFFTEDKI